LGIGVYVCNAKYRNSISEEERQINIFGLKK